jgi:hypothetical protein
MDTIALANRQGKTTASEGMPEDRSALLHRNGGHASVSHEGMAEESRLNQKPPLRLAVQLAIDEVPIFRDNDWIDRWKISSGLPSAGIESSRLRAR